MTRSLRLHASSLTDTERLGHRLGERLFPGAVVALVGTLGAGKTHLVRAIGEGLGVRDSRVVTSPTFVLIQEYDGRLPIYHFDAYRLTNAEEFFELGAHEYFQGDGVSLVEWADRVESFLPPEHLQITIEITGETSREFEIEARGPKYEAMLEGL